LLAPMHVTMVLSLPFFYYKNLIYGYVRHTYIHSKIMPLLATVLLYDVPQARKSDQIMVNSEIQRKNYFQ